MKILSINPGSTSTKIALYEDLTPIFVQTLRHPAEEISKFERVFDQYTFRKELIISFLKLTSLVSSEKSSIGVLYNNASKSSFVL